MQAFFVPSGSMLPTLQIGDRIVVLKFGYTIHRGDIVVFRRPPTDVGTTDSDLVKRVIGLPGETISSIGSTVLINGRPLKEPWLPALSGICSETAENITRTKIPPAHYFVMGDCRGDSADSRTWGTLPVTYIVARCSSSCGASGTPTCTFSRRERLHEDTEVPAAPRCGGTVGSRRGRSRPGQDLLAPGHSTYRGGP